MTANTPGGRTYFAPAGTPLPPDGIPTDGPPGNGWHELGELADAPRPTAVTSDAHVIAMEFTVDRDDATELLRLTVGARAAYWVLGRALFIPRRLGPPRPRPLFRRASDLRYGDTVTRVLPVDATVTCTTPLSAEWLAVFMVYPWGGAAASLRADAYVTLTTPGPSFTYAPPSDFARRWARHLIDTSPTAAWRWSNRTYNPIPDGWPVPAPPAWPEHAPTPHERARLQEAGLTR